MTEITSGEASESAAREMGVGDGGTASESSRPELEPLVPVELTGCPSLVPRMLVPQARVEQGELKIPFGNGYDHFDFRSYADKNGQRVPVFAWTGRTKIAE